MREHEDQGDEAEQEQRDRERRRRRREERHDTAEAVGDTCELVDSVRGCGAGCGRLGRGRGGGDGGCGCDGPCDLTLLRVSTVLLVAAAVVPARGGGLVRAALRGYQRWLTRFTPACPSTPSCSAFALAAVGRHGARRGLRLAAARVEACGAPHARRVDRPGSPTRGG